MQKEKNGLAAVPEIPFILFEKKRYQSYQFSFICPGIPIVVHHCVSL